MIKTKYEIDVYAGEKKWIVPAINNEDLKRVLRTLKKECLLRPFYS